MTIIESAFEGAGKKAGIEIWRIENFKPVSYPASDYGKFYSGDSYIILKTKESSNGILSWDLHFWLGKDTSQDEKGTAAIKAVELDDQLGGAPVQHRETEEYESPEFLNYFKGGVRYAEGGIKSGFKHYDPTDAPPRLYQVKGKRNVRVREVEVSVRSMNRGDCYILETTKKIYVYVGKYSKRTERLKAVQAATSIKDQEHGGKTPIQIIDSTSSENDVAEYFTALGGGSRADMADAQEDDDKFEKEAEAKVSLFRVTDSSGSVKVEKVGEKPLTREMLVSQDCFILDGGKSGIYTWIGKKCSKEEKISAMKMSENFLAQNNYPSWTRIQRVVDGGETPGFKQYFKSWKESNASQLIIGKVYTMEKIAASSSYVAPKIQEAHKDREKLRKLIKNLGTAVGFCPDDGQGEVTLYRVENFKLAPVPNDKHGIFFGGDSYVMKYKYIKNNRENYLVYFWQGTDSTQDEKASAALHAVEIDNSLNGRAIQIRVQQGHEPAHFLRAFKGKMIIFRGGHASGFKNVRQHDTYDANASKLFQIQGTCQEDTRAIEVLPKASSLDSDDVFVLDAPKFTYIWIGKGASTDEKNMAKSVVDRLTPDDKCVEVNEGSEPDEFWQLLGGKGTYNKNTYSMDTPELNPRLFHCSITPPSTKLDVEEVYNFTKDDLNEDDVMVLDTGDDEIFIWIGKGATPEEKKNTNKMADDYISKAHQRAGGSGVTISIVVKQDEEPDSFKVLFPNWV